MLKMCSKKGQATPFIAAGIILVAIIALFVTLGPRISEIGMSSEEAKKILSAQAEPLRDYTSECIKEVSSNYFKKAMMHGGYYYYNNLYSIYYSGGEKVVLAYKSTDGFKNILPGLNNICGNNFDNYMEQEGYKMIDGCVNNFKSFKRIMGVEPGAERKITADCSSSEDIIINAEWPIKITKADAEMEIKQKDSKLLIPLKRMWTFANDIVNKEAEGKDFIGSEIESYISSHRHGFSNLLLESRAYPTYEQTLFFIISKPYRIGEEENRFYFGTDRYGL